MLQSAFQDRFGIALPENLNEAHKLLIVASEFDASSRRIFEYLAEQHGVAINTVFFNTFFQFRDSRPSIQKEVDEVLCAL